MWDLNEIVKKLFRVVQIKIDKNHDIESGNVNCSEIKNIDNTMTFTELKEIIIHKILW